MTYSPSRQMMAAGRLFVDSFNYGLGVLSRNQWGIAHRRWLLDSGQYIKTSEQTRFTMTDVNTRAYKHSKGWLVPVERVVSK